MQKTLTFTEIAPFHKMSGVASASKYKSCDWQLEKDEIWLGNTRQGISNYAKHLKTIRLGVQAYCIKGTLLSPDFILPLIIKKSEEMEYDRIMVKRMSDLHR